MSGLRASRGLTLIPLLFMLAVSSACSERITSAAEQETAVQLRVPFDAAGPTIQASRFVLTVTGPGIEAPIVSELAYEGGLLTGSVVVPAGPKRLFRVDAYDRTETLIYSGKALSDVKPGSEVVLDIDLRPQVPMIQVVPMHVETLQGDLLALTIRVYRLPDVSRIDVRIVDHRLMGNTYIVPDDVVIDPQTAKVAGSTVWTAGDYSTNISLTLRNATDRLVDENGNATLAILYYQTHIYEVSPVETATFIPTVTTLLDKSGSSLPVGSILSEGATALLYDYSACRAAYWDMGATAGVPSSFVSDGSGNALSGTAYGTTFTTGRYGDARAFNGSTSYVTVPDNVLLDMADEITIKMWVRLDGYGLNPQASLVCKRTTGGPINYQLILADSSSADDHLAFYFRYGAPPFNTYRIEITDSWRTQDWFHILFYYRFGDPSSATFVLGQGCFINEMPGEWITGSGRDRAPLTDGALLIGKDSASETSYFEGSLDEVELFDIVWTPGLVQYYLFTGCR